MGDKHIGSTLESFLEEEGICEEATENAVKCVASWQNEMQMLVDEGFNSGISTRTKDDIRRLGLQKLAEANKQR